MKNIIKLSALFCAAVLTIVGCQEELDTAQYSDTAVTLASFGPNPAMRGGTVTFYGSNLDKIAEVEIPGMDPIKDIEVVKSGKVSEIRVKLDLEAPQIGYVNLKTADGKTLTTKSELTYKEPIVFDSFTAKAVNYPGETITINGTYVDLIKAVIFEGGEEVEVEEGSTRHEAKVVIPANALTGVIVLTDKAEIESLFYSTEELVIGEPTVVANAKATLKAGDAITFKGEHLEMIQKITFDGAVVEDFTLAEDNKSISLTLPATAKDGEFQAVSFAGNEYKAGEIENVIPVITKVAPEAVKAGKKLTLTGTDLDLVESVACSGEKKDSKVDLTFSASEKELTIDISSKAVESDIVLTTTNGTEIKTALVLVHPTITAVSPAELYAGDEPVVVTGTDLDLAVSATLGGKAIEIGKQEATKLELTTTSSSVGGKVVITLDNGETVESVDEVKMNYHSLVIVNDRPDGQHIGELVTLKGEKMNLVESIYIGEEKVTKYQLRSDNELSFLMPWNKVGSYTIKFVLYDGSVEEQPTPIEVWLERTFDVAFEGEATVSWNNAVTIANSRLKAGLKMVIEYKVVAMKDNYSMLRVINSDWSFNPDGNATYNKSFTEDGVWEVPVTAELMTNLDGKDLALSGYGCAVTKVTLIGEISQEKIIFEDSCDMTWNDAGRFGLAYESFEGVVAGQKLVIYLTHIADWGQIQINDGGWGNDDVYFPEVGGAYVTTSNIQEGATRVELTITEAMLELINTRIGDYQGLNVKHASPSGKYSLVLQGADIRVESIAII